MDIFGRCNGGAGLGVNVPHASAASSTTSTSRTSTGSILPPGSNAVATTRSTNFVGAGVEQQAPAASSTRNGTESSSNQSKMQLTGASAPGNAASPESGVSPLADAYTKMTSDIFAERTLGDYMSEHPGELVRTGELLFHSFFISKRASLAGNFFLRESIITCLTGVTFVYFKNNQFFFFFLKHSFFYDGFRCKSDPKKLPCSQATLLFIFLINREFHVIKNDAKKLYEKTTHANFLISFLVIHE